MLLSHVLRAILSTYMMHLARIFDKLKELREIDRGGKAR